MVRTIFLFFLLPSVTLAQDTINRTDEQGRKQGFWRKIDTIGQIIYEGRFNNNVPYGDFRYYYPDGKIKTQLIYSCNGACATAVSYFRNGKKMAEGKYIQEKRDSVWLFFSETTGSVVAEETYRNGVKHGTAKTFFLKGGVSEIMNWNNGIREGKWEYYYSDGKVKTSCLFENDEKNGPFKAYDTSGKLMIEGRYKSGHQDGQWIYYNEKGIPVKRETYVDGKLIRTEDQLENKN